MLVHTLISARLQLQGRTVADFHRDMVARGFLGSKQAVYQWVSAATCPAACWWSEVADSLGVDVQDVALARHGLLTPARALALATTTKPGEAV